MNSNTLIEDYRSILASIKYDPKAKRGCHYTLTRDIRIFIPSNLKPLAPVSHEWFSIDLVAGVWYLTVRKGYSWDGCTGATDFTPDGTFDIVSLLLRQGSLFGAVEMAAPLLGSVAHDPLYQFGEAIAAQWGVSIAEVLKWADLLFKAVMVAASNGVVTPQAKRYFLAVRVFGGVFNWFGRTRSKIVWNPAKWFKLALVAAVCLVQGCATAAWHNYQVAEAERSEREQIEAGLTPLIKTNGALVRENWFGYVVAGIVDAAAGVLIYKAYQDWQDDGDTLIVPDVNNTHNYYAEPDPVDAGDIGGE